MELWRTTHLLLLLIFVSYYCKTVRPHCIDLNSNIVSQGLHYVPGTNPCTVCICDKGSPKWCKSVLCSAPQNCKSFQVGNTCCEFKCLDDILTGSDGYKETYDVALRFIASAVTAVLSLSLLFFLFHRLRRRKLLLHRQNQQISDDQRSLSSIGYIAGSLGYLPESYLSSGNNELEFHYEDASAHYSLWKPPGNYFPRGEAPPPYEEAVRSAQLEHQQHTDLINTQLRTASNTILNSITSVPRLNGGGTGTSVTVAAVGSGNVGPALVANGIRNATVSAVQPNIQPQQEPIVVSSAPVNSSSTTMQTTACRHDNLNTITNANVSTTTAFYHPPQSTPVIHPTATSNPTNNTIGSSNNVISATTSNNQYVNITVHHDGLQQSQQQQRGVDEERPTCSTKAVAVLRKVRSTSEHVHEKAYENVPYGNSKLNNVSVAGHQREIRQTNQPNQSNSKTQRDSGGRGIRDGKDREILQRERETVTRDRDHQTRYENISSSDKKQLRSSVGSEHTGSKTEVNYTRNGHQHTRSRQQQQQQQQQYLKNSRSQDSLRKAENSSTNVVSSTNGSTFRILDGYKNIEVIRNKDTMIITEGVLPKSNCPRQTLRRDDFYENTRSQLQQQHRTNARDNTNYSGTTSLSNSSKKPHQDLNMSLRKSIPNSQIKDITTPLHRTLPKNVSELLARSEETILDNPSTSGQCGGKLLLGSWRDASGSAGDAPVSSKSHGNLTSVACASIPTAEQLRSKCLVSYQCLSSSQDDDDYRSECENCKSAGMITSESEDMDVVNETMTLQRRPLDQQQGEEMSYYRASLTLPTKTRKPRVVSNTANREAWFATMPQSSSSDSE